MTRKTRVQTAKLRNRTRARNTISDCHGKVPMLPDNKRQRTRKRRVAFLNIRKELENVKPVTDVPRFMMPLLYPRFWGPESNFETHGCNIVLGKFSAIFPCFRAAFQFSNRRLALFAQFLRTQFCLARNQEGLTFCERNHRRNSYRGTLRDINS